MQKILIAGTGGVGGYVGAQLIRHAGAGVAFLARGEHLKAIRTRGLTIRDNDEYYTVHPTAATDDPASLGAFDLIIVSVKATALESTLEQIAPNVTPRTILLPLLNGVEHNLTIQRYFPEATVLDGHLYILSNLTSPGTLRRRGSVFRIVWGSPEEMAPAVVEAVTTLFDAAQIRHKLSDNIQLASWRKYLFIASFATLTSRYAQPMDRILTDHTDELQALMQEILTLANAKAIPLTQEDITTALTQASKVAPGAKTSLQLDIEAGKPAEIDALCGYVVREGRRLNVRVPEMQEMHQQLKKML